MVDDARMDRMENSVLEIHKAVIRIENEHGMKLEALFDGQDLANKRLTRIEYSLADTANQMKGLNALVGLLQSIARDHEERLVKTEL